MMVVAPALAAAKPAPPPPVHVTLPLVEVLDASGAMTAPFVRTAILKVEPELLRCTDGTKWQGTALAWIVTDWRGKVSKLELAVGSASVEKCLAKVLRTVVVQNTQVRATAFVKLVVGPPPDEAARE